MKGNTTIFVGMGKKSTIYLSIVKISHIFCVTNYKISYFGYYFWGPYILVIIFWGQQFWILFLWARDFRYYFGGVLKLDPRLSPPPQF
jgi:hypothetical protein